MAKPLQQEKVAEARKLLTDRTVEEHCEFVCRNAVEFTATMHLGQHNRLCERGTRPVLMAAQVAIWERQYPARRGLVYAIAETGMSTLVPRVVWEELLKRALEKARADHALALDMPLDLSLIHLPKRKFET